MITFIDTILGPVGFDAVLSETISASSTVTSNPIESGAEVNDHIFTNPKIQRVCVPMISLHFMKTGAVIYGLDRILAYVV